jgi:chitinase
LIKKVGGLDELEKQLKFQSDDTPVLVNAKSNDVSTTPPSINKSLFERVLNRASINKNVFNGGTQIIKSRTENKEKVKDTKPRFNSVNSRSGPQSAGLDKLPELEGFLREKPQYVTLKRNNTRPPPASSESDYNEAQESSDGTESSVEEAERPQPQKNTFKYTSIRRERPSVVTKVEEKTEDDEDEDEEVETTVRPAKRPQYVSFSRQRVRTEEPIASEVETTSPATERFVSRNTQR